jgi:hypothetical protein
LSLSCASAGFCIAVGGYDLSSGGGKSFAERWDGSSWSLEATLSVAGASDTQLMGVSCTSPRACFAVGEYNPSGSQPRQRTLVERWNGTRWSAERTPSGRGDELVGVSCASARACMAVGQASSPLVESWDGRTWSVVRLPTGGSGLAAAVSCTSRMICTVVGNPLGGDVWAARLSPGRG